MSQTMPLYDKFNIRVKAIELEKQRNSKKQKYLALWF
jgi:hypothetical protein